jgi:hypothetical protein
MKQPLELAAFDQLFRSNFLVNVGYGDHAGLHPKESRLAFEAAVTLL